MQKIIVIGCPGSGKSVFSRALHERTGIPLFHLDLMYWNPDRTAVDSAVFQERLAYALRQPAWIIDGNYMRSLALRMQACDTVFFLDYPTAVCLSGARERRGKPRPDMPWTETADAEDPAFLTFIQDFRAQRRPEILALLEQFTGRDIHIFENRDAADAFLMHLA